MDPSSPVHPVVGPVAPVPSSPAAPLRPAADHRLQPVLLGSLGVTLLFFYLGLKLFVEHHVSVFGWAASAWNHEDNYEHAWLIAPISAYLVWRSRARLRAAVAAAPAAPAPWWGWLLLGGGVLLYLASARTLQPRLALAGVAPLLLGLVAVVWGRRVARIVLFPITFLLFTVPMPGLEQSTVGLQLLATRAAVFICTTAGLPLHAVGTTIHAVDQSFSFEIAGGCSGINSLMAITTLTAVFVHLTQDRLWKKILLFMLAAFFAVVGNVARIVSVMFVARFINPGFAGGVYHDASAWIVSFPFAFAAMWVASQLVNGRLPRWGARRPSDQTPADAPAVAR